MKKPYYAVIFTSTRTDHEDGYAKMAQDMEHLAKQQSGFIGLESARDNMGITVSYWKSLEAIAKWKQDSQHILAQEQGKNKWYQQYSVRICKVEHEYHFFKEPPL